MSKTIDELEALITKQDDIIKKLTERLDENPNDEDLREELLTLQEKHKNLENKLALLEQKSVKESIPSAEKELDGTTISIYDPCEFFGKSK